MLQEYPTEPPAHVLNGWVSALWGLYDVSLAHSKGQVNIGDDVVSGCRTAFERGVEALAARISHYDTALGWSRYDLFPHRIVHVASPFYHRLHIEQLRAMARLCPGIPTLAAFAARWEMSAHRPISRAVALARKVAFRMLEPRRQPL